MRILHFFTAIFFLFTTNVLAAPAITDHIEKIDLNLKSHEMAVTFLNISKGEATLIQGPNGENVLVNMGGEESQKELESWLHLYHVKNISKLVMAGEAEFSHLLLENLASAFQIKEVLVPASVKINNLNGTVITPLGTGARVALLPELSAVVQFSGIGEDEGLDITLQFYDHRIFLMNSFSKRAEQSLLQKKLGKIDIFKVPNCRPVDSLSEKLINHVNPQISILNGANKEILDDLYKTWSEVYFTKNDGTVTIKFTAENYEVFTIPAEIEE